jgi:hypothetical protein
LIAVPFLMEDAGITAAIVTVLSGAALIVLSIRSGPIRARYGSWDRVIQKRGAAEPTDGTAHAA